MFFDHSSFKFTYILLQNKSTLVWQENGSKYLPSILLTFFFQNLSENNHLKQKSPCSAHRALSHNAAQLISCERPGLDTLTRIPSSPKRPGHRSAAGPPQARDWETGHRGPSIPKVWEIWWPCMHGKHGWGPPSACLPRGSVSFWPAFLCTMAGYVIVSLLLCSFRTTDRPVLDMRTVVIEKRKTQ